MAGAYQFLTLEKSEGIVTLTLNRPEVRNALHPPAWEELGRAVEEVAGDAEARALIVTGAGEKAFAAGADIREVRERTLLDGLAAPPKRTLQRLEDLEKPTVAAVNGYALGGGCEIALACDIRLASENARLGLPEVNLGIIPGAGGTQRLVSAVGLAKAKELILTGEVIDAKEALRIGLVSRVVALPELLPAAREVAKKILSKGPLAIRLAKLSLNAAARYGPEAGMLIERLAQSCLLTTQDKVEGTTAFLEKRKPEFRGSRGGRAGAGPRSICHPKRLSAVTLSRQPEGSARGRGEELALREPKGSRLLRHRTIRPGTP